MRAIILFSALPYAALFFLLLVPIVRSFGVPHDPLDPLAAAQAPGWRAPWAWRYGLGIVLAGHLLGFLLPRQLMALERLPAGVLAVEATALATGVLALAGLATCLRAALSAGRGGAAPGSFADTLLWTLLALAVVSGLATGLVYRWGTSWVGVTIVPYLRSLLRLRPEVALVAEMPSLVRLHVLAGIGAAAVLPFSRWGTALARLLAGLRRAPAPRSIEPSTSLR